MQLITYADIRAFSETAEPFLARHEAENNLMLGLLDAGREDPAASADWEMAAVLDGAGEPLPDGDTLAAEVADRLAASLLAAKFLQGMPIAGAAGGLWDGRVTHRLLSYTNLCCRRRFLAKRRPV